MCPISPNHSPRFRKPPYDPTRSDFPNVVLTLANPPAAFPKPRKLKCWRICTPLGVGLHAGLGLAAELFPSLVGSTRPPGTQSPFARRKVLPPAVWRPAPHQRALPLLHSSYRLMRQTKSLPPALDQPPPAGLCRFSPVPAGRWPFPTLSLRICLYVQGPLPRLLSWCIHPFLPTRHRPSQRRHPVGAFASIHALATSAWGTFRGCSHSFIFKPVELLATPVAPTVTPLGIRWPWLLRPRISRFVTSPSRGYANRPNRAIGGRGTSTLQDSQPCRLLRRPSPPLSPSARRQPLMPRFAPLRGARYATARLRDTPLRRMA